VLSVLGPQIANQAGWFAAEMGGSPGSSTACCAPRTACRGWCKAEAVLGSLILFALIYALLFAVFVYLLNDKISTARTNRPDADRQAGPAAADRNPGSHEPGGLDLQHLVRPGRRAVHRLRDAGRLRPRRRRAAPVDPERTSTGG
jgi:hypothetical protein